MSQSAFSVSWDAYQNSLCRGLSSLQQNGEFVDMTLAAEGHMVRVHRMVMSLVSPYIKQLIATADCPHPVIFLNNVSYKTLCLLLEYTYTGAVQVPKNELNAFIYAGEALHFRGIGDMDVNQTLSKLNTDDRSTWIQNSESHLTTTNQLTKNEKIESDSNENDVTELAAVYLDNSFLDDDKDFFHAEDTDQDIRKISKIRDVKDKKAQKSSIQYTISSQGKMQMILNRFMYHLDYTGQTTGHRRWRCIHRKVAKCDAKVITRNDVILKRQCAHNHPYHDAKILQKIREGTIVETMEQAEYLGNMMLQQRIPHVEVKSQDEMKPK